MYFVYITRNKINNKMYVGITNGNDKDYLGSGIRLKNAVKKYGKENFENSILEECESIELLEQRERFWISFFDSVNKGYNISTGGSYRKYIDTVLLSESINEFWKDNVYARLKMSKTIFGKKQKEVNSYKRTEFVSEKQSISKCGNKNPMFGKSGNDSPTSIKFSNEEIYFIVEGFKIKTLKQLLVDFNKYFNRNIKTVKSIRRIIKESGGI